MALEQEAPYRWALGIFWVLNIMVRYHYQRLAGHPDSAFVRHATRERRLFLTFLAGYLALPLYFATTVTDFAHLAFGESIRWCGALVLVLYTLLFAWTHRVLGRNWSGGLEIHRDHTLVTTGPYRFIRHPMYAAFYLSAFGILLLSANWFVSGIYVVTLSILYFGRIRSEEAMMLESFGEAYARHMRSTWRLFPKFLR